jgi:hypothetical protein
MRIQNPDLLFLKGESLTKKKDRKSKKEGGGSDEDKDNANGNEDDWGDNEEDAEWGEDTSEDAVRRRMEALSGGLGGLVIDNDMDKTEVERINIFHTFVKQKIQVWASPYRYRSTSIGPWSMSVRYRNARLCMESELLRGKLLRC